MAGINRRRALALAALGLALGAPAIATAQDPGGDLPISSEWLANTLERASTTTSVQNNTIAGALKRRDDAVAAYKQAVAAGKKPSPLSKPEYAVVWSAKQNGADVEGSEVGQLINNATINPQGLADLLNPQFLPGLDGWQVIDERKLNVDGTE